MKLNEIALKLSIHYICHVTSFIFVFIICNIFFRFYNKVTKFYNIFLYSFSLTILNSAFSSFGKFIDDCLFYNDRSCLNILHVCNNLLNTVENIAPPRWYRQSIRQPQFLCVCGAFKSSSFLFLRAWDTDLRVRSSVSWPFASEIAKQCRRSREQCAREYT